MNGEKGLVLPLVLVALAIGTLVITPFIGHASSSLIGSRIYGQAISEQYSCDAGAEWALWRLKENPVLTTNTVYHSTSLEPIPSEINGSSFPTTELRFVEDAGATETVIPEWQDGKKWQTYTVDTTDRGTITVVVETDAPAVDITLEGVVYELEGGSPYVAEFEIDSADSYSIQVITYEYDKKGKKKAASFPGIITITYPIASYDIRAQKGDCTITVRATASYLATRVISWQIE